jgi:hypothetical protein
LYGEALGMYGLYMNHVTNLVGGVYTDRKTSEQPGAVFTPVAKARQKEALRFLTQNVFEAPTWLLEKEILDRIQTSGPQAVQQRQAAVLNSLLTSARLGRMVDVELETPGIGYPVVEFLNDLRGAVWQDPAATARDPYRRALQRAHVTRLAALLTDPPAPPPGQGQGGGGGQQGQQQQFNVGASDLRALARAQLTEVRANARAAAARAGDSVARAHLLDIAERIDQALEPR